MKLKEERNRIILIAEREAKVNKEREKNNVNVKILM